MSLCLRSVRNRSAEWQRADTTASGRLLPQGLVPAAAPHRQAHVAHQHDRDGARDGRAAAVPADARAADQSDLAAAAASHAARLPAAHAQGRPGYVRVPVRVRARNRALAARASTCAPAAIYSYCTCHDQLAPC